MALDAFRPGAVEPGRVVRGSRRRIAPRFRVGRPCCRRDTRVTRRSRRGSSLFALVVVLVAAGSATCGEGPATLAAGTTELGIAGGYSVSFNEDRAPGLHTVYGTHVLLRVGRLVTDEHGSGMLRGNLELTLEPTYIHLRS